MADIPIPSRELANKILSKLSEKEKITAFELSPYSGCCDCDLYSLKELADFLDADVECLTEMRGFVRFVDPDELQAWIATTYGDEDLVTRIAALSNGYKECENSVESYIKRIAAVNPIKELLLTRLAQCREVLWDKAKA